MSESTDGFNRLIDILCAEHALVAEVHWPVPGGLNGLADACSACRAGVAAGPVRALREIPEMAYRHATATHEAAHAVVGIVVGHDIESIETAHHWGVGTAAAAAWINRGPFHLPVEDHLAMVWAGQIAAKRWLAEAGYDSAAHRLDMSYLGHADTTEVFEWTTRYSIPADTGWARGSSLLDTHWEAVSEVAEIVMEQRLTLGSKVRELVGKGIDG